MNQIAESPRATPPLWLPLSGGLAGLLFGGIDLLLGYSRAGERLHGALDHVAVVTTVLGHAAMQGLLLGIATGVFLAIARRIRGAERRLDFGLLLLWLGLSALFVWINRETFEGGRISKAIEGKRFLVVNGFRVAGCLGIFVALFAGRALMRRSAVKRTPVAVAFMAVIAAALLYANTRILINLYAMIHTQWVAAAWILLLAAAAMIVRHRPRIGVACLLVAFAVIGGALLSRSNDSYRRLKSSVIKRGASVQEFATASERIMARVVSPPASGIVDVAVDTSALDDVAAVAAAERWFAENLQNRERLNVLLIAMDTVRGDHVSFNGYARPTTPNLDRWAKDAFVFRRGYAPYPTSNLSYSSAFTGLFPRANPTYGHVMKKGWEFPRDTFLAAFLKERGWQTSGTSAFNKANVLDPAWFGLLAVGMDIYNPDQREAAAMGSEITDSALRLFETHTKRPFFHWAHYLDPHAPYDPPGDNAFGDEGIDAYDSEILYTDAQVGRLLDGLEKNGEMEKTILVVFSDHGEEFLEHQGRDHNSTVYEEQIHVPFMIRIPGVRGREIHSPVSLVDLTPTILGVLGFKDTVRRHGRSLLPLMVDPERDLGRVPVYAERFWLVAGRHAVDNRALILGRKKLIRTVQKDAWEMFDLETDPRETTNLIGRDDELEATLRGWLRYYENQIEAYHTGGVLVEREDPAKVFREQVDALLSKMEGGTEEDNAAAATELTKLLFDYLGEPSPDAGYVLGDDGLDAVAGRVARMLDGSKSRARTFRLLRLLIDLRKPASADALRAQLKGDDAPAAVYAALALARMGIDEGREVLRGAMTAPSPVDKRELAAGLATLNDDAALPWLPFALVSERWRHVGQMILALDHVGHADAGWAIRDYLLEGAWTPKPIQNALARSLSNRARSGDADARRLLILLAVDSDPAIRETAALGLERAGIERSELDRTRDAAIAELEFNLSIKNGAYELAGRQFRTATKDEADFNAGLRLRYARYLHLENDVEGARVLLEAVKSTAPKELDRKLAERRIAMLGRPARILDPKTFSAEVSDVVIPEWWPPNQAAAFSVTVRNTGTAPWQGGVWRFANSLVVRFEDENGAMIPQKLTPPNHLSPMGVLPGETTTILICGVPPEGRDFQARPVITFEQPWLKELADGGVIYRHPSLIWVSTQPKAPGTPPPKPITPPEESRAGGIGAGRIEIVGTTALDAAIADGVTAADAPVYRSGKDGWPLVSVAGFVQLADEGPGFYYGCLVPEHADFARAHGLLNTNNWGDIESMSLATRVVADWRTRYPDGPRLGIDEISGEFGGYPDYDKDGVSDHKTHQTGMNVNFLVPCRERPEKYIHVGRRNESLYDPALFRELVDVLVDNGAHRMTTNQHMRLVDDAADLPPTRHKWKEIERSANGFSVTYGIDGRNVRMYLLAGQGEHGDHVNALLWKSEQ